MMNRLQPLVEAKGREIFAGMRGQKPAVFSRKSLSGHLMNWSMRNEALKVQLFRFVDVLPSLRSASEIARHACEYLGDGNGGLPAIVRWGIRLAPRFPWLTAALARRSVTQMAGNFILAPDVARAIPVLRAMRSAPLAFTIDILGETAVSEREADIYQARYFQLIDALADEAQSWPRVEQIDADDRGDIPRANISVKISALYSQIRPTDPEGAIEHLTRRLMPLLARARERGVFINFDMESHALKDLTLELFKRLLDEPVLEDYPHAGLALQAYLRETEHDLDALIAWAESRGRRITIRLIKGAYWDYETITAGQHGWPVPVFGRKAETDANFERLARRMLECPGQINCAFGTHSIRSMSACIAMAEDLGRPKAGCEFQMLFGMAEPIKATLLKMGHRVRDYCPIGEVLPGMSYLVRRLLENTSNEGFLRATFTERAAERELLRDPEETALLEPSRESVVEKVQRAKVDPGILPHFQNEPLTDFTVAANRRRMSGAIETVRAHLGERHPLIINGQDVWTQRDLASINPARPGEVVGRVSQAGCVEAQNAIAAAREAFEKWRRATVDQRARVLERAAEIMHQERFELAAVEIFETGKAWTEADADVAEAIDFCRFYAGEMRRIAEARYVIPGETSVNHYVPRGIGVVIAPWNFPLAILCGMTVAAIVTGNAVVVKPSGQSSVIGARLADVLRRAGAPPGVMNFVPGPSSEIGDFLVGHPEVAFIAFTGSRQVGLRIYELAGKTGPEQKQLKKVICEMGGKNALIIDSDADLDEALPGIMYSAFGYQGQKCSALSRLIVLEENYQRVVHRLVEAARSLTVGPPEHPGTMIGPVIDRSAYKRILDYIEIGKTEAKAAFQGAVPAGDGFYIPPTIFTEVPTSARIWREEIFGPVLSVTRARNLDEAISLANDSIYGLTGGVFSRSPNNIARVSAELEAGNIYINRGITGAIVARHPFGGFKMSGGGAKAGGRDYLHHFLFPRVVTENRMRRGFAPEEASTSLRATDGM